MHRTRMLATAGIALALATGTATLPAQAVDDVGFITGVVFEDINRDGLRSADEPGWGGAPLDVFDSTGRQVATGLADAAGAYSFKGLAAGSYTVAFNERSWWDQRAQWVPTTTGNLRPRTTVAVSGTTTSDLGLRRIVRSSYGSPISRVVGPDGLVVESYNDAVSAQQVHDAIDAATLRGAEAGVTTVLFDVGQTNVATTSYAGSPGSFRGFSATVQSTWLRWLDQADATLMHEYGHAWSLYHEYIVQQDGSLASYLQARGVAGDTRLGSSRSWSPEEMVAEDYRQLFASPTARQRLQENVDLPPAKDVPGLADFLSTTFMTATPTPSPTPEPTPIPLPAVSSVAMNPSPVTKTGTASFSLSVAASVTVVIEDATGALVRTLAANSSVAPGPTTITWDRRSNSGVRVRSGNYTLNVRATSGDTTATGSAAFQVR